MQRPDPRDRSLRRALWSLAEIEDDARQWVVEQLTEAERVRLLAALDQFDEYVDVAPLPQVGEGAGVATPPLQAPPLAHAIQSLQALPDWLALRVLLSMPSSGRREALRALSWRRRWQLRHQLLLNRGSIRLTVATAEALLVCVRDSDNATTSLAAAS